MLFSRRDQTAVELPHPLQQDAQPTLLSQLMGLLCCSAPRTREDVGGGAGVACAGRGGKGHGAPLPSPDRSVLGATAGAVALRRSGGSKWRRWRERGQPPPLADASAARALAIGKPSQQQQPHWGKPRSIASDASSLFFDAQSSFEDAGSLLSIPELPGEGGGGSGPGTPAAAPSSPLAAWPGPAALLAQTQHRVEQHQERRQEQRQQAGPAVPASTLQSLPSDLTAAFVLLCSDEASQLAASPEDELFASPEQPSSRGAGPGSPHHMSLTLTPAAGRAGSASPGGSSGACTPERQLAHQRKATRIDAILRRLTTVSLGRELPAELPPWVPQPPLQFDERGGWPGCGGGFGARGAAGPALAMGAG
jgi:hypothetical protein